MSAKTEEPPIACMLGAGEFKERSAWIANLNLHSLKSIERSRLSLQLVYSEDASADVKELVRREQQCCGFLSFSIRARPHSILVEILATERAREAADMLFDQFIKGHEGKLASPATKLHSRPATLTSGVAMSTGLGIAACAVCCALPFALPAVGLASAGSVAAWISAGQGWLAVVAAVAVSGAWAWVGWTSLRTSHKPAARTLWGLAGATVIAIGAFAWPTLEALIC